VQITQVRQNDHQGRLATSSAGANRVPV
jgi:hypothetical protein